MPAAAAKVERINDQSGDLSNNKMKMAANQQHPAQDPTKIANTIIEKKIRNLEKRKARLLEIKALEDKGQQLEPDQVTAVKKLDSVVEMIDTLKEINKNVTDSLNEYAKQLKKQQKKEQMDKMNERHQIEMDRSILLLRIENVLSRHSSTNEYITTLDEKQQKALDSFVKIFNEKNRNNYVEKAFLIIDGSKKEFSDGLTYLEMKDLLEKLIENCSVNIEESNNVVENEKVLENSKESPISKESHKVNNECPNKPQTNQISPNYPETNTKPLEAVEVDLQKDPAVIASGFVIPSFPSANFIPANNGMEMPLIYPTTIVNSSIPSQTFTNTSYAGFIQNKVPMFEQAVPITDSVTFNDNMNLAMPIDLTKTSSNDKVELLNGGNVTGKVESQSPEKMNSEHTSQENDSKVDNPNMNGNTYNKRNYRGNNRGNSRNFSGNSFRGRGSQKNFGYFNGQPNSEKGQYSTNFQIGNFNGNRATSRQNGGGGGGAGGNGNGGGNGRSGYYRSNERHNNNNNARNHFNTNSNTYQGPSATLISKQ